jgi:tetratricopeptide (TPR) repeat protein
VQKTTPALFLGPRGAYRSRMADPADRPSVSPSPSPSSSSSSSGPGSPDDPHRTDGVDDGRASFTLDVTGATAAEALAKLKDNVAYWVARGRYQKVRLKRGGKPVLPDIPIGALIAVEAAAFFATGPLRAALGNVVGRALFEVELVNEAESHYRAGLDHLLAGDLDDAARALDRALAIDERFAKAHLQKGVVKKMQGDKIAAAAHFERVVALDRHSDAGREAKAHLARLREPASPPAPR